MEVFDDYLTRRANILLAYLGAANLKSKAAARRLIVSLRITPYIIEDEQAKINMLQSANGSKPVASQKATVRRLGWAEDPDAELAEIQADEERENVRYEGEPTY